MRRGASLQSFSAEDRSVAGRLAYTHLKRKLQNCEVRNSGKIKTSDAASVTQCASFTATRKKHAAIFFIFLFQHLNFFWGGGTFLIITLFFFFLLVICIFFYCSLFGGHAWNINLEFARQKKKACGVF